MLTNTVLLRHDVTVGELANEFSVSKRTILRDLQELEQAGFPLYSEVGAAGGYHILKERILPPIAFSERLVQKHTKNISCIRSTAFARPSYALRLSTHGVTGADGDKKKYPLNTSQKKSFTL